MKRSLRAKVFVCAALASCSFTAARPAGALLWPSETARIERDLGSTDVAVRRRAALRLRELPVRVAERALTRALGDDDLEVRLVAVQVAKSLRVPGLSERVLGWLTESDPRLRLAAADVLALAPSERALSPLVRALSDSEPEVRAAAASALGASGSPEAVIGLLGRLDDADLGVKESVVRALARLGDPRAVVPLVSKIEDARPSIRRAVAVALGALEDRRAVSALVLALRDPEPSVRAVALTGLGAIGDPSAVPSISAVLSGENTPDVRVAAIDALARLGTPEALARLLDAFEGLPDERDALVRALAENREKSLAPLMRCVEAAPARERADGCALALARTHGEQGARLILEAVRQNRVSPEAALAALAELEAPEALPLALEHVDHRDPAVRRAALFAAGVLLDPTQSDGRAVEPLELAFQKARARRSERVEIIHLLGLTGSPRAAKVLVPIAERADDLEYRLAALSALGTIRDASVTAALLAALSDVEPSVRLRAALSIRRSAPHGVAEALVERLERAGAEDRRALALALGGAISDASESLTKRVVAALALAHGAERDALIEVLAHATAPSAVQARDALVNSKEPSDRAKIAEALAFVSGGAGALVVLANDADPAVRANAVWSLGAVATAAEVGLLLRSLSDRDEAVAANAAAALGRTAIRLARPVGELCRVLDDPRAAVRANALAALRLARVTCDGRATELLARDPSANVRARAAAFVRDVDKSALGARALRRCAVEEPNGAVAAECVSPPRAALKGASEVVVFVVPAGESTPIGRAAFALQRPDFLVRHGRSDRRGAVNEMAVPNGELRLDVPAALDD